MSVSGTIRAGLRATQAISNPFGALAFTPAIIADLDFTNGTGANQADILWVAQRTVASGANDDIDLAGVLSNAFGATITAAELAALIVVNRPLSGTPNTTNLTIGGGSNPITTFLGGSTPTVGPIRPGGVFLLSSPDAAGIGAVTAGTADILRIANSAGASATYQIGVLARSVA